MVANPLYNGEVQGCGGLTQKKLLFAVDLYGIEHVLKKVGARVGWVHVFAAQKRSDSIVASSALHCCSAAPPLQASTQIRFETDRLLASRRSSCAHIVSRLLALTNAHLCCGCCCALLPCSHLGCVLSSVSDGIARVSDVCPRRSSGPAAAWWVLP
ncbi:hypothetical protein Aduo_008324 [Ancylostoma duodenale]